MEIDYDDPKVAELFEDFKKMQKKKGLEIARATKKRIKELEAAVNFASYLKNAPGKPHPLTGDKAGQYAVDIDKNKRLILKPVTVNGKLDLKSLTKCKKVIIKGVIDYHGGKTTRYIP